MQRHGRIAAPIGETGYRSPLVPERSPRRGDEAAQVSAVLTPGLRAAGTAIIEETHGAASCHRLYDPSG